MSNTEKKNLLAIDDLLDDLDGIINWAIRYKNDVSIPQDFKPLEGMSDRFDLRKAINMNKGFF